MIVQRERMYNLNATQWFKKEKMCVILNIFLNRNKQRGNYKLWCTFQSSNFWYLENNRQQSSE